MSQATVSDTTSIPALAPSRRALFGAGAPLLAGATIATTANADTTDAELLAACAQAMLWERRMDEISPHDAGNGPGDNGCRSPSKGHDAESSTAAGVGEGARGMSASPYLPKVSAADFILFGVNRLDCAITALGCVIKDLDVDRENDGAQEVETVQWLFEVLRDEARNIRECVDRMLVAADASRNLDLPRSAG